MIKNQVIFFGVLIFCALSLVIKAQDTVKIKLDNHCTESGEQVIVDIRVCDFKDISSFQFALKWNPDVLAFVDVENVNEQLITYEVSSSFNISSRFTEKGELLTNWVDLINLETATLTDSSLLFSVIFDVVTTKNTNTTVQICPDCNLATIFTTEQGIEIPYETSGGDIKIQNNLLFQIDDLCVREGEQIEVDVNTRNFKNILSFQFSLLWDSLTLSYVDVKNLNTNLSSAILSNILSSSDGFTETHLRFSWFSNTGRSISISDDRLFTVVFDVVGSRDTTTELGIYDGDRSSLLLLEVLSDEGANQNLTIQNANITTNKPLVELSLFNGIAKTNQTYLEWQTQKEPNSLGFYIEKSTGQMVWQEIGFIKSKGVSTERQNYSFVDNATTIGKTHYRLKQAEFCNGENYYLDTLTLGQGILTSDTLIIADTIEIKETFRVYPNPSSNYLYFEVEEENVKSIVLTDQYGNIVKKINKNTNTISIHDLPSGTYYFIIEANEKIWKQLLVKLPSG